MKTIFLPILVCLFFINPLKAQHFVGDMTLTEGNTAVFTVKPQGGDITGMISVLEYYLRWEESFGNSFTFSNIVNNTTDFPGMNIVTVNNDVTDAGNNNQHFAFVGLTSSSKTYVQDSTYEVFRVTIGGTIPAAFHLVANNQTGVPYYFTVQGDGGADYTPYGTSPFVNPTDSAGAFYYKTYMYSILSVDLISFKGTAVDCSAQLRWVTGGEIPGTNFEIQHSKNGLDFTTIKIVPGVGALYGYEYTSTVPMVPGKNFFRLNMVSINDHERYSDIIKISNTCSGIFVIQAAPNPVTGGFANLLVTIDAESSLDIQLMDITGRQIKQYARQVNSGINKIQLPLPKLAGGQYIISIRSAGNEKATQKIFVQD